MIDLIKAATLNTDANSQKQAEATLLSLRHSQTERFFLEAAQILTQQTLEPNLRQSAGTLLSVSLKAKKGEAFLWDLMTPPSKSAFKDMVLGTMVDQHKPIRRAAANIVAAICCIEIPRKEWEGIIEKITSNMNNSDPVVKEVSILTIGFICEQLKEFGFTFDERTQELILSGILLGLKQKAGDIAETAFGALREGIPSILDLLKNNQYRDFLMGQIADALRGGLMVSQSVQCLIEYVKYNFGLVTQNYAEGFATLLDPLLLKPQDENVCVLAMEFWATFAKEEHSIEANPAMHRFITGPLGSSLVEKLLKNLVVVEEEDDDGNGVSESAASTLEAIFQGEGNSAEFKGLVLNFVDSTLRHSDWKCRQASIRAFATVLMGLPSEEAQRLVNISLVEMVKLLGDPKQYVQYSALKSLSYICEDAGEAVISHAEFLGVLQAVVKKGEAGENFMRYVCKVVDSLCQAEGSTAAFASLSSDLAQVFMGYVETNHSDSIINSCFGTLMNLIKCANSPELALSYIDHILARVDKIDRLGQDKRDLFYAGFFTIINTSLLTIRRAGGTIRLELLSTLYSLVNNHFQKINNVEGDGYYIVSALAYFIPNDRRLVDDFWKYIEFGLKRLNQDEIFRATISCICDFAAIYRETIADKIDPVFNELLDIFEKNMITRELKIDVLMCIGEMFLQCGEVSFKHLKRVMDVILLSCEGVVQLKDQFYAEVLQETVIETLMCIYHGLNSNEPCPQLGPYVQYSASFITYTTDKNRHPKLDYVKDSMVLLADVMSFYPNQSKQFLTRDLVNERLAILQKYNKDGHLTESINYISRQLRF